MRLAILFPLLSIFAAIVATGCSDDFANSCELPSKVLVACQSDESGANSDCVMDHNMYCNSRLCAIYDGSDPFCSLECKKNVDCPSGSSCAEFFADANTGYCVPDNFIPEHRKDELFQNRGRTTNQDETDSGTY